MFSREGHGSDLDVLYSRDLIYSGVLKGGWQEGPSLGQETSTS